MVGFCRVTIVPGLKARPGLSSRLQTACTQSGKGTDRGHDVINVGRAGVSVKVAGRDRRQRLTKFPTGLSLFHHVDVPEPSSRPLPRRNLGRRTIAPRSDACGARARGDETFRTTNQTAIRTRSVPCDASSTVLARRLNHGSICVAFDAPVAAARSKPGCADTF